MLTKTDIETCTSLFVNQNAAFHTVLINRLHQFQTGLNYLILVDLVIVLFLLFLFLKKNKNHA